MSITFNTILRADGINPSECRLIRHKDSRSAKGRSPYELWRDDRPKFDLYQATQSIGNRKKLTAKYWAVFVVNPAGECLFAGIYQVRYKGLLQEDTPQPHTDGIDLAQTCDLYELTLDGCLSELIGRLLIDWGSGALAWAQYADRNEKLVTEIRRSFQEPKFPGFMNFIEPLSALNKLPVTWVATLKSSGGVYLLTCPRTKEQYVGSATGAEGFWGRWQDYVVTGHGDNVGLKSRDLSDYQVSILEVAGSSTSPQEIQSMEGRWQRKLQSKEMGLNRNIAGSVGVNSLTIP
ncbi:MAG TPA: GIY-YIG nuclease family protein [Acidovorax sp.]|nr:GIY-YIG nuclease family protein [Acidovorax sp.]